VLAEIGNGHTMECHITEVEQSTPLNEILEWLKSREDHLEDGLRGQWAYARIFVADSDHSQSLDNRRHMITVHAKRNKGS
jgi:hypothetical protein